MHVSEAYLDGWLAHRGDVDVDANPYDVRLQPRSHAQWLSGWSARFAAVKHGLDLPHDEADLHG